jgi:hypothetical protein
LLKNGRDKLVVRSPEKAGVGGSTPSLATIFSIRYRRLLKGEMTRQLRVNCW